MFAQIVIVARTGGGLPPVLTYRLAGGDSGRIAVGAILRVPLRQRFAVGIVIALYTALPEGVEESRLKEISDIPPRPLCLPLHHIAWAQYIANFYRAPLPSVFRLMLPEAVQKYRVRTLKKWLSDDVRFFAPPLFKEKLFTLNPDQQKAFQAITTSCKPVLLHGVTGSGKTEVYRHLAHDVLKQGKQVIVLVPEIALTTPMIQSFSELVGDRMAVFHSRLTAAQEAAAWWRVATNEASLVIGSRSALFAPVQKLGAILIDEEHAWTYKHEQTPYYNAQDIAAELAKLHQAFLVLGTATPRAESYLRATQAGEWVYATLPRRVNQKPMPPISIVDMREEFHSKNYSIFSTLLQKKMRACLEKKQQIILFVNRRGMAGAMLCRDCGAYAKCPRCDIGLKFHRDPLPAGMLICHYCGHREPVSVLCPRCRSPHFKQVGLGTERVEQDVRRLFPEARVIRADQDTTRNADGFTPIYNDFFAHRYDILVGTQMVAKGLDFEKVSLVGIVLADVGLHIPDFRSAERVFQLTAQVSGRAGRGQFPGEVVLQTYDPTVPALHLAAEYRYDEFMALELKHRRAFKYPPFSRLIKVTLVDADSNALQRRVKEQADVLIDIIKMHELPVVIHTAPAMLFKRAGQYYFHLFIRGDDPQILFEYWKPPFGLRIDIDPISTS